MRDGVFVDQTRLSGGSIGTLGILFVGRVGG